jgi:hypothetical protein
MNYPEYVIRNLNRFCAVWVPVAVYGFGVGGLLLQVLTPLAVASVVRSELERRRRVAG